MVFLFRAWIFSISIAELQRTKRASEVPLARKIGNPSSRESLVMTSPYERPSSSQTLEEGDGRLNVTCDLGCCQLIHFIYLLRSLSHPSKANSDLVSTHKENDIIE